MRVILECSVACINLPAAHNWKDWNMNKYTAVKNIGPLPDFFLFAYLSHQNVPRHQTYFNIREYNPGKQKIQFLNYGFFIKVKKLSNPL